MHPAARNLAHLITALSLLATPSFGESSEGTLSATILGPEALTKIETLGPRCASRYGEFTLANFSRAFIATGNDACFYVFDQADDGTALKEVKHTCSVWNAHRCDVLVVDSNFTALGISFSRHAERVGGLNTDPDLFQFGPGNAVGAIVWIPGRSAVLGRTVQITAATSPDYLREFNNHGWDIYHYYAPPASERSSVKNTSDLLAALKSALGQLRERGYRKIVLAGHSWGASLVLYAGSQIPDIVGIIATSPGFAVSDSPSLEDTATGLNVVVSTVRAMAGSKLRVAIAMTEEDEFNPNAADRLAIAGRLLRLQGMPHLIIHPTGGAMRGHSGTERFDFALRYGRCLREFVEADTPVAKDTCAQ